MPLNETYNPGDVLTAAAFDAVVHQVNLDAAAVPQKVDKSTLTAKGDVYVATSSGVVTRQAVGTNGQVLTADSTQSTGIKWAAPTGGGSDPLTTAGDIVTRTSSATVRKPVGTNGQVLQVNTSNPDKLEWATPAAVNSTTVDAAGAVMNTDTSTAAMLFVVDEDDMLSNSATKVPTQQSVKAYVDAHSGTGGLSAVDNNDGTGSLTGGTVVDNNDGTGTV